MRYALALAALTTLLPAQDKRPNVLLISIDDLNDWVGVLGGHPQAHTPNIDRLANRGVLFTNAHCQAPVCTPSRASLFSGRLPSTTGMYFLQPSLAKEPTMRKVETLVERFRQEGWETLGVGKVHHGDERRFFGKYGGGRGGFGPRPKQKLSYKKGHPLWDWGAHPERDADMPDHKVANWAIAELGKPRDKPFFLAVGFWRPHVPMYVPKQWFAYHPRESVALPETRADDREDLPPYAKRLTIGLPAPRHEWFEENGQWKHAVQSYLASTTFVDHQVGRVLDALAESSHAENTIVILFSDHGFHLGEKRRWAKRSLWERSTRVPLVIATPGVAAGRCAAPVGLVDLYPTLLELAGLEPNSELDGHSVVSLLREPGGAWPHAALTTFGPGNHAVRLRNWRYIRYRDGSEELYDHTEDPNEWRNLARDAGQATRLRSLRRYLPSADRPMVRTARGSGLTAYRDAEKNRKK